MSNQRIVLSSTFNCKILKNEKNTDTCFCYAATYPVCTKITR